MKFLFYVIPIRFRNIKSQADIFLKILKMIVVWDPKDASSTYRDWKIVSSDDLMVQQWNSGFQLVNKFAKIA